MTQVELAWVAGFVDGEGCIQLHEDYSHKGKYRTIRLRVAVANTNIEVLKSMQTHWGGSIHIDTRKPKRQPCGSWILTTRKAGQFLVDILPYLRVKRSQAVLAIELQTLKARRNRTQGLSAEDRELEQVLATAVRELKVYDSTSRLPTLQTTH